MTKPLTTRRTTTALAALALAGVLAACGTGTPDATVTPNVPATQGQTTQTAPAPPTAGETTDSTPGSTGTAAADLLGSVKVTPKDAATTALAAVPNGKVVSIELERSSGTIVWEVDVATSTAIHEVHVDVAQGKVVANRPDRSSNEVAKKQRRLQTAKLTYVQAIEAAATAVPGGHLVELDLDESHGKIVWEADVITDGPVKHDLKIDAITGKVIEHETEAKHS
ncbi:MAG: PepSY domain-containing protein [Intrasporangium sp.]|uniref:PepSY domain-containing protein n=1 Tax=Intrasporangium sp. TaxID=1925024 RepID=UPI0026492919|nr:PepSY domain-containing protein [Intrasporangium sp.]MDN5797383.1 PepSY domain-containing protein [Intrasporangium sp.]